MEEHKDDDVDDEEYDEDGQIIPKTKRQSSTCVVLLLIHTAVFETLPVVEHTSITYPPFNKDFYEEHEDIAKLTPHQVRSSFTCIHCVIVV